MNHPLVRLQLRHGWYAPHPVAGISLQPDAQSRTLLRRFDLWWRYGAGEWSLYTGRTGTAENLLAGLARALDGAPLCLVFSGDLAHLASITGLPEGRCTLPHFSSRSVDRPADGGTDHILRPQTDGMGPLATIWLYADDLGKAGPETCWIIQFEATRLPWIYYVVNRSHSPLHRPFMRASDGRLLAGPVETSLPDGDRALRFDTDGQALTFSRMPTLRLGLFDQFQSPLSDQVTEVCLIRSLPLPDPRSLIWDRRGPDQKVSAATTIYL